MKPLFLVSALAVFLGLGIFIGRQTAPAPSAISADMSARIPGAPADSGQAKAAGTSGTAGLARSKDSPEVKALFAGFDRRQPAASQLAVLQRIMAGSPADLARMAQGMAGPWRDDPGWLQTKSAVMQRWVELAPDDAVAWARGIQQHGDLYKEASDILGMLANIDPARAMTEAQRLTNPKSKNSAIQSVLKSIAQVDPAQAFRLCESLPHQQRLHSARTLFSHWAQHDPAAAAAATLTMKDRSQRETASDALIERWTIEDPAGALAWAKGLTEPTMRQNLLQSYFRGLGQADPKAAIEEISGFPRHQQQAFLDSVVQSWVEMDPDAATEWVLSRPNAIEQQKLIVATVGRFAWTDSEQAAKLVAKLSPGPVREQALKHVMMDWMWGDSDAAVAFTKDLPPIEQRRLREKVVQGLAWRDAEKAVAYLKDNPIDDPASDAWGWLGWNIASQGTSAKALEWANALPDAISRRKALPEVFSQMVQENPAEAAKLAAALPDEVTRSECLSTVAGAWAGAGMEEALAWAKGLPGKDGEAAMGAVLEKGAAQAPTEAAEQFNALMSGVPTGTKPADALVSAAGAIATAYFAENEQAAAQWAASLPQDDARAAAVKSLAQEWAQHDPSGASEWIGTLPGGKPRDAAVGQLVGRIAPSDPAAAFAWADTVTDTGDRSNLLQATFASWRRLDAPAARTAIQATDWPDEEKTKWLEKVK